MLPSFSFRRTPLSSRKKQLLRRGYTHTRIRTKGAILVIYRLPSPDLSGTAPSAKDTRMAVVVATLLFCLLNTALALVLFVLL